MLAQALGEVQYQILIVDMVWSAELEFSDLVPADAEPEGHDAPWDQSVIQAEAEDWAASFVDSGSAEEGGGQVPTPVALKALEVMAKHFGIDVTREYALLDMVRQAVCTTMPHQITERTDAATGASIYVDTATNDESTTHPFETGIRRQLAELRQRLGSLDQIREENLAVIVRMDEEAVVSLLESPLAQDQKVSKPKDGRVTLRAIVPDSHQTRAYLRSYGATIEVLGPKSLRDEFVSEAKALAKVCR